jgi:hypothetical protein
VSGRRDFNPQSGVPERHHGVTALGASPLTEIFPGSRLAGGVDGPLLGGCQANIWGGQATGRFAAARRAPKVLDLARPDRCHLS